MQLVCSMSVVLIKNDDDDDFDTSRNILFETILVNRQTNQSKFYYINQR